MAAKIDLLDRDKFIQDLIRLIRKLSDNRRGCCFSLEGSWGIGKTFVLEEVERELKENGDNRYFLFHYNCWQHDYYEEPAVAIISAMLCSLQNDEAVINQETDDMVKAAYQFVKDKLKEIASTYIENKIGVNLVCWADEIMENKENNGEMAFDAMFNFSQTIHAVREKLKRIAEERTIVLVVDELDRCIPAYAIKVLERLHHIFYGLENVVVLMAIDRSQLEHSVEEMFGIKQDSRSMDIEKYMKKFIDFSMIIDYGMINKSIKEKYSYYFERFDIQQDSGDEEDVYAILALLLKDIDIRRQEKLFDKAYTMHSLLAEDKADISVLTFEIMYEILKSWDFDDMDKVAEINTARYIAMEEKYGQERIDVLKEIARRAESRVFEPYGPGEICLKRNLYGKVIWYFASLFNEADERFHVEWGHCYQFEFQVVKEYCEYGRMIK